MRRAIEGSQRFRPPHPRGCDGPNRRRGHSRGRAGPGGARHTRAFLAVALATGLAVVTACGPADGTTASAPLAALSPDGATATPSPGSPAAAVTTPARPLEPAATAPTPAVVAGLRAPTVPPGTAVAATPTSTSSAQSTAAPTSTAHSATTATVSPVATASPAATAVTLPPAEFEARGQDGRLNLLVLGIDKAASFEGNTDVMMLVSIDPETQTVFILSIPRDLCLAACDGHPARINEVYKREGLDALKQTLRHVTGLRVDFWMTINFYGVERIIDELGGVRIWSNREFDERLVYLDTDEETRLILEPGWNNLNGREAVAYGRSRRYDRQGDFARICRQQQVVRALRGQALSPQLVVNAPGVLTSLDGAFRTDFPVGDVPALGALMVQIPPERIHSWTIHRRGDELFAAAHGRGRCEPAAARSGRDPRLRPVGPASIYPAARGCRGCGHLRQRQLRVVLRRLEARKRYLLGLRNRLAARKGS